MAGFYTMYLHRTKTIHNNSPPSCQGALWVHAKLYMPRPKKLAKISKKLMFKSHQWCYTPDDFQILIPLHMHRQRDIAVVEESENQHVSSFIDEFFSFNIVVFRATSHDNKKIVSSSI